jgi:hypothetical protein
MALARMAACDGVCMTPDQQIRKALELLAPPRSQRAECQHDIKIALAKVEQGVAAAQSFRVAGSKKGKAEVMRYCAALRRLRNAYHALGPAIRPWFSLSETAYVAGKPTVIDREIAIAEVFLARPSPRPRPDASRNKLAVAAAYDLRSTPSSAPGSRYGVIIWTMLLSAYVFEIAGHQHAADRS